MEPLLKSLAGLFFCYLFADKYLFRGQLASIFFGGFATILHIRLSGVRKRGTSSDDLTVQPAEASQLILTKRYSSTRQRPGTDKIGSREINKKQDVTFDEKQSPEAEETVSEWRAPRLLFNQAVRPSVKKWDDPGFGEDLIVTYGPDGQCVIENLSVETRSREVAEVIGKFVPDMARDDEASEGERQETIGNKN